MRNKIMKVKTFPEKYLAKFFEPKNCEILSVYSSIYFNDYCASFMIFQTKTNGRTYIFILCKSTKKLQSTMQVHVVSTCGWLEVPSGSSLHQLSHGPRHGVREEKKEFLPLI